MSRLSLRARLAVAMVGVAVAALGIAGLIARREARAQVNAFFDSVTAEEDLDAIEDHYRATGSWDGIAGLLLEIGAPWDERLLLVEDGRIVADSHPFEADPDLSSLVGDVDFVIDGQVTTLYTLGRLEAGGLGGPRQDDTLAALDRWFLGAGAGAAAAAGAVALLVAARLDRPLARLRRGVEAIADGDLSARLDPEGPPEIAAVAASVNRLAESLTTERAGRQAMTADLAHELRNPVSTVRAYVEAMVDGIAEPRGEDLAVLHGEILRLQRLIDDLQQLALADAGTLELALDRHDLRALAERAAAAGTVAGTPIALDLADDASTVRVDADRILQVIANLVDNAARHSPPDRPVRIRVEAGAGGGSMAALVVEDDGPGLPPAQLESVFDRLHQLDASRTGPHAGLGLAIVRSLVELHGGTVCAGNRPEGGAMFRVELPAG